MSAKWRAFVRSLRIVRSERLCLSERIIRSLHCCYASCSWNRPERPSCSLPTWRNVSTKGLAHHTDSDRSKPACLAQPARSIGRDKTCRDRLTTIAVSWHQQSVPRISPSSSYAANQLPQESAMGQYYDQLDSGHRSDLPRPFLVKAASRPNHALGPEYVHSTGSPYLVLDRHICHHSPITRLADALQVALFEA